MNDVISIGAWILVFPIASLFTAAVCVYLSIWNRRYRTMAYASSDALHEAITIIDALASRGVIVCDECHRPGYSNQISGTNRYVRLGVSSSYEFTSGPE